MFREMIKEAKSGDKAAYKKYFSDMLDKYNISSPSELSDSDKKKFFNDVDAGWDAQDEKD